MVSIVLIGGVSLAATILVFAGHTPLYRAIHVPEEVFDEASLYLLIVGAFILVQGLYLTFSAMIRAFAMVKEVMIISVIMNAMNIVGNAILINGWFGMPQLGAVGAAISTDISKLVGLALMIGMFFKSHRVKMGNELSASISGADFKKSLPVGNSDGGRKFFVQSLPDDDSGNC